MLSRARCQLTTCHNIPPLEPQEAAEIIMFSGKLFGWKAPVAYEQTSDSTEVYLLREEC